MRISMSDRANPCENALAERVNGILKQEFTLNTTFTDFNIAKKAAQEAIKLYDENRPHLSLGYKTSEHVYNSHV